MKIGIIGRTEILFQAAQRLKAQGHQIVHIITAREAPEYTKSSDDFRRLADSFGVPFASCARITEVLPLIEETRPDVGVSMNYPGIIPETVIDAYRLGILNAHGGDLPRYRGNACQAWAIINGEDRIGLCIHKMIGGELDSGDIIARRYYPIDIDTKITQVYDWFGRSVPELFEYSVSKLEQDPGFVLEVQSRQPEDALRCYPRIPADGRIDWRESARAVLRLVNASNKPYSGAFCDFEDGQMKIWDAELVIDNEKFVAVPGQIVRIGKGFVDVACGKGKLRVNLVETRGELGSPDIFVSSLRSRFC